MMKILFLLTITLCSALALPSIEEKQFLFTAYLRTHNKHYRTTAEYNQRFEAFSHNLNLVQQHNEEAEKGLHSFTLGMNKFADWTNEEYRAMLKTHATAHQTPRRYGVHGQVHRKQHEAALPASVDWRTKGVVSPVKDQGQCGSCWAFSAVGSMEGAYALANGKIVTFSEQELVDCVNGGACDCNAGGEMQDAFAFAIQNGIEYEDEYPYCACSKKVCHKNDSLSVAHFSSYNNVTVGSEADLQAAVVTQPGVSIAIDASSFQFQLYSSGVFDYAGCKNAFSDLDHGVLAVGYGTLNGKDYWIVKNSWGSSWGQSGYILMSRNKNNQCGVATDASYILV